MGLTEKGPGDISYPTNKPRNLKKMPDGNPFPYEMDEMVEGGVYDDDKVDGFKGEPNYKAKAESQTGDDGRG